MGSQSDLTIALISIVMFSIAIIGFSVGFAGDNDSAISISDDADITIESYTSTKTNASQISTDAESTYENLIQQEVESGSDVVKTPESFTLSWNNVFGSFKNIIGIPRKAIFGGEGSQFGIFFQAFMGIILFLSALYIIKTWRGNP